MKPNFMAFLCDLYWAITPRRVSDMSLYVRPHQKGIFDLLKKFEICIKIKS